MAVHLVEQQKGDDLVLVGHGGRAHDARGVAVVLGRDDLAEDLWCARVRVWIRTCEKIKKSKKTIK